ncbi:MAG: single-stranded-DNA-specific exonuclease RecJ [Desulfosarcinaceae bacterium]|nr:single-stranded-DNA-specific exonuclease RecJ [Desulfosarcinaceae bacterium]
MEKQWTLQRPDPKLVEQLQNHLHCHRVTATILANRQIRSTAAARAFVTPSLNDLKAPFNLKAMPSAVERIAAALRRQEKILVFGDYDVDGVTATVAVFGFLKACGAKVAYHIPHRIREGYSIRPEHIDTTARAAGVGLIITVDCGSASNDAVSAANAAGIDIIITDHHQISAPYPDALAVLNPQRPDCTAGLEDLAGVGVAFCLLVGLRRHLRDIGFWKNGQAPNLRRYLDLVALGTIADMVPMRGDNRILTRTGLAVINQTPRPGIAALMTAAGLKSHPITAEDIAFRLAPRINAAGRMDHARIAAELLLTRHPRTAAERAAHLSDLNRRRQETEQAILAEIETDLASQAAILQSERSALVLASEGWHEGVLGIVASKLTQNHHLPAVVIALNNGRGKGSARSIPGLNLYACLRQCAADLQGYGGHAMAAGLQLDARRLDAFRNHFEAAVQAHSGDADLSARLAIDCELYFQEIAPRLVDELENLQPFGSENPAPLFMAQDIVVLSAQTIGQRHRRLKLRQRGNRRERFNAIWFNVEADQPFHKRYTQIAFRLQWNRWNGAKTIQLQLEAVSGGSAD